MSLRIAPERSFGPRSPSRRRERRSYRSGTAIGRCSAQRISASEGAGTAPGLIRGPTERTISTAARRAGTARRMMRIRDTPGRGPAWPGRRGLPAHRSAATAAPKNIAPQAGPLGPEVISSFCGRGSPAPRSPQGQCFTLYSALCATFRSKLPQRAKSSTASIDIQGDNDPAWLCRDFYRFNKSLRLWDFLTAFAEIFQVNFDGFCDELKSLFSGLRSRDTAGKIRYIGTEARRTLLKDHCVFHREQPLVF